MRDYDGMRPENLKSHYKEPNLIALSNRSKDSRTEVHVLWCLDVVTIYINKACLGIFFFRYAVQDAGN